MTNTLLKSLVVILLSGAIFASCKKEKQNIIPTAKDYLTGKWDVTHFAYDENNNKVLDAREKEESYEEYAFIFKPDGTGYTHYQRPFYINGVEDQPFTWNFQNNEKEVRLIMFGEYYTDTLTAKLNLLNGSKLIMEISENYGYEQFTQWILMDKGTL